jgi:hypothetical protein
MKMYEGVETQSLAFLISSLDEGVIRFTYRPLYPLPPPGNYWTGTVIILNAFSYQFI